MGKSKKNVAGRAKVWLSFDGENKVASNVLNARIAVFFLRHLIVECRRPIDLFGLDYG